MSLQALLTGGLSRHAPWQLAPVYVLLLLGLSAIPASRLPDTPELFQGADKVVHLILYSGLGVLLRLAGLRAVAACLLGVLVGSLDEAWQSLIPGRHPDCWDLVADVVGVVFGWFACHFLLRRCTGTTNH